MKPMENAKTAVAPVKQHIPCLDGIRGGLALWVFWGHLANVVGFRLPLVENLALAVDLFMLLSGFIMAWQWEISLQRPQQRPFGDQVSGFWLRRFFRISPLYYMLFFVSMLVTPTWSEAKLRLMSSFHPNEAATSYGMPLTTLSNVGAHLTYIFGLIPRYASNNALPDWSLSLEMQFYVALPFLMVLCRPSRVLLLSLSSVAMYIAAGHLFTTQDLVGGSAIRFPHPSLLPLKIHIFAAGMALGWLAANKSNAKRRIVFWIAFLVPLIFVPHPVAVAALGISALILSPQRPIRAWANFLGKPPFRMSGDLSYCVYLVHPIPSYLILDLLSRCSFFRDLPSFGRFAAAILVLTPIVYALAYLAHRLVEKPGIDWGKRISDSWNPVRQVPPASRAVV
ncbi:MAG TPA: acyltransferase [Opitutaceae bacterium]|nr:acyltransferase [Opitutaceae bacterium]